MSFKLRRKEICLRQNPTPLIPLVLATAALPALGQSQFGVNIAWLPVTDAERKLSAPVVDKNAGAEALFWRVHVTDELLGGSELQRVLHHYVRLKVFNEEGKKQAATTEIAYADRTSIMAVAGRTIKPDGSIVELDNSAVHDRDVVRLGRRRVKVKSFAMPGVEPGAIVEYRWKEIQHRPRLMYLRLQFQREFPVQKVTYFVKPLSSDYSAGYRMSVWPFNCQPTPMKLERDGFNSTTLENVPAFREEPMMPAEANVRPWMLIFYNDGKKREPDKYWTQVGKDAWDELKRALKSNDEIRQAAQKAIEGTPENEKVLRLIRYLRANFRGLWDRNVTDAERTRVLKQLEKDRLRTAAEIFKSGIGTPNELNTLFATLASEVGLEARPALVANRSDVTFVREMVDLYFLSNIDMAVKLGEEWKLFDVSTRRLPPHMLGWTEEGVQALLSDPKTPTFIQSPVSAPGDSTSARTAKLALSADGTLEGSVEEFYSGHTASDRRGDFDGQSEAQQREEVKEDLLRRYPNAEVSEIRVENADNSEQLLKVQYCIRIPGYAQRTGRRLFFQPVFFQRGIAPLFAAAERKYDVHFRYAWKEFDSVRITLPEGFELDNAENPGSMNFGKPGAYVLNMSTGANREFICTRELVFGNNGGIFFPQAAYGQLKTVFDEIRRRDNHSISLKMSAGQS